MEYTIHVLKHPSPFVKTRPDVIVYNGPLTETDRQAIRNLNHYFMEDLGEFGISASIPPGWDEETVYQACQNVATVAFQKPTGFTRERATRLIGATVIKRPQSRPYRFIEPGQRGKIVEIEKSDISDGYAVIVDWGREQWAYDSPEEFDADLQLISAAD